MTDWIIWPDCPHCLGEGHLDCEHMGGENVKANWRQTQCPVCQLHHDKEAAEKEVARLKMSKPEVVAMTCANRRLEAKLGEEELAKVVLHNTGHWVNPEEDAMEVARAIRKHCGLSKEE